MPAVSMVVCLHRERELLARLLTRAEGCFDDLIAVHDGADRDDVRSLVEAHGGRFFERPRRFSCEGHFIFGWKQARHDWIFRPDADEFPSPALAGWLREFRAAREPGGTPSGYEFIFPLWNGSSQATARWPHRQGLFHRQRVRFIGLTEQWLIPDDRWERIDHTLCHQPKNQNYGRNYLLRMTKRKRWVYATALGLMRPPTALECWRWEDAAWPGKWEAVRQQPFRTAIIRLFSSFWGNARAMIRSGEPFNPVLLAHYPLHHWVTCQTFRAVRKEWARVKSLGLEPGGMMERGSSPQRVFILDSPGADAKWETAPGLADARWIIAKDACRTGARRISELRARVLMRLDDLLIYAPDQAVWAEEFLCQNLVCDG